VGHNVKGLNGLKQLSRIIGLNKFGNFGDRQIVGIFDGSFDIYRFKWYQIFNKLFD